ncbi:MAG: amidohydrolase family protein [Armatimonadota bacterium]|nr:amidohydrolase family protein [Armatimonadota bacterium]MCX7776495.1 amidohydrolase family protein [Armatimonadota bacterium]MDW8024292.1 amidohydrolase family protein [Armatimonadota bacterium]
MVIDFHCHVGTGEELQAPWTTRATLELYLERAEQAGIEMTVVFAITSNDYERANGEVAEIVANHPGRLIGFARVHAKRDAGKIEHMLRRAVEDYGFKGVKVHGAEAMPTRELCKVASEMRLPVLVDIVGRVEVLPLLATEFKDVPFVVAHLGSFSDDWRVMQFMPQLLSRYPNIYADTSGVRFFDYIREAVEQAGPKKLLFGSDGPLLHPGIELHKVKLLNLPPEDEALILGGNAHRLIFK